MSAVLPLGDLIAADRDMRAFEAANPEPTDDEIWADLLAAAEAEVTSSELCRALDERVCGFGSVALTAVHGNAVAERLIGRTVLRVRRELAEERLAGLRRNDRQRALVRSAAHDIEVTR